VAEFAGVSRATVSRVINSVPTVDPELRQIVEQAIAATGYVPQSRARVRWSPGRTGSVALVISEPDDRHFDDPFLNRIFTDPFLGRITAGALEVLRPEGIHLVIIPRGYADPPAGRAPTCARATSTGSCSSPATWADPLPKQLHDLGIPAVLSARPGQPVPLSYVDVEQQTGARLAAEHLVARGLPTAGHDLRPAGHAREPGPVGRVPVGAGGTRSRLRAVGGGKLHPDQRGGRHPQVARRTPEVDGMFIANDLMAEGALQALRDLGHRVPEDVAVVVFDDSSAAVACRPQLTTVRQPVEEMAAEMARLLLLHIMDPDRRARSVIFQPSLVVRQSA